MEAVSHGLAARPSPPRSPPVLLFLCDFCCKSLPVLLPRVPRAGWLLLFAIRAPQHQPFLKLNNSGNMICAQLSIYAVPSPLTASALVVAAS